MKISISRECSEFLRESNGHPLVKFLPKEGSDQRKLKVRKGKANSNFDISFNTVFSDHPDLRQRCIFTNGIAGLSKAEESSDPLFEAFYIFPSDGYKFIYSPNVFNSSIQYKETLEKFVEFLGADGAIETFSDVLKYDYMSTDLASGISLGSEIILYGIQYYYALKMDSVKSYSTLFSL